jgi:hypothetical protein
MHRISVLTWPRRVPAGVLVVALALLLFLLMIAGDSITALTVVPLWVLLPPLALLLLLLVFAQHGRLTMRTEVPVWTVLGPVALLLLLLGLARANTPPSPAQQVATPAITGPLRFGQATPLHPSPVARPPVVKRVLDSRNGLGSATYGARARTSHAPVPTATAPGTLVIHNEPRAVMVGLAERGARHVVAQGLGPARPCNRSVAPRMTGGRTPGTAARPSGRAAMVGPAERVLSTSNRSTSARMASSVSRPPAPLQNASYVGPRLSPAAAARVGALHAATAPQTVPQTAPQIVPPQIVAQIAPQIIPQTAP